MKKILSVCSKLPRKLPIILGFLSLCLTGCGGFWTRVQESCVPRLEFTSTEDYEFAIIRLDGQEEGGNLDARWSDQRLAKGEYFFIINAPNFSGTRALVEGARATYDSLPSGTKLTLDGAIARIIPLGANRMFTPPSVSLRGIAAGETVWVTYEDLGLLDNEPSSSGTRNKLEQLGIYDAEGKYVTSSDWKCP